MQNNPVVGLLELRARRQASPIVPFGRFALVSAFFPISCVLWGFTLLGLHLALFHLAVVMVVVPASLAHWNKSFVQGLSSREALEEVLATPTRFKTLLDGAVYYSVRELIGSPLMAVGLVDGLTIHLTGHQGFLILTVLWPLGLLASVCSFGYSCQIRQIRAAYGVWGALLLAFIGHAPFVLLGTLGLIAASLSLWWQAGICFLAASLINAWIFRCLGGWAPGAAPRLRRLWRKTAPRFRATGEGRSFYSRFAHNPVLWREYSRARGPLEILVRHRIALFGAALMCVLALVPLAAPVCSLNVQGLALNAIYGVFVFMVIINLIHAGISALSCVSRERAQRTLDSLVQTGITSEQFGQGVMRAAALPRLVEIPFLALLALGLTWTSAHSGGPATVLATAAVAPLATGGGAALGLWAAASQESHQKAFARFTRALLGWELASLALFCCILGFDVVMVRAGSSSHPLSAIAVGLITLAGLVGWFWFTFCVVPRQARRRAISALERGYYCFS